MGPDEQTVSGNVFSLRAQYPDLPVLCVPTQDVPHQEEIDRGNTVKDNDDERLHGKPPSCADGLL